MTVLVTGGAGYVGSHALLALENERIPYVVLDNLSRGHCEFVPDGKLVVGDVGDRILVRRVIEKFRVSAVMHFAAFAYVGESVLEPAKYYRNNVAKTVNLLDVLIEEGVRSFVFSSTCSTYGQPQQIPIREDHPQNPLNPYGSSKRMVERILEDADSAHGLRYVALRYFNAAGADAAGAIGERHDPETHLIPLVLQAAGSRLGEIRVLGTDYPTPDGTCVRDYVHVTDLASAHVLALRHLESGNPSNVFNLGNGKGFSVLEVIETARRVTGREIKVAASPRRPGDPHTLVGSAEKARRVLGWTPRFDRLDDIIETAWHWHQNDARRGSRVSAETSF